VSARRSVAAARRGFTLVELLAALSLFVTGGLAMAGLLTTTSKLGQMASRRAEMATLAEGKLEELRAYGAQPAGSAVRARLDAGGSLTLVTTGYADSLSGTSGTSYRRQWTVAQHVAGTRLVTVAVTPRTSARYQVRSVSLTSAVALR
jgi:prepilin-type N-terminal cleavage/methylation domain-containing protein